MFKRLATILFLIISSTKAVVRPSASLSIMTDEGFLAYLEVPKSFGRIHKCWFQFREEPKVLLTLNTSQAIITDRHEELLPFANNICGMRVNQLSAASAAIWSLEAENEFGDVEFGQVKLQILQAQKTRFETHIQREIGKGTIACSKHDSYTKHCKIIDKETGSTWEQCEAYTTIRHQNMIFECLIYNWGRMKESYERIIVDIKNSTLYTVASIEETANSFVLRCQFEDTLYSCQAEMPDHINEIYIMDGLYNGNYSAYDTVTSKSRCALEIPKALASHEIGLWRILNYETSTPSGCLYYVGENKTAIIEKELKTLDKIQEIHVYQPEPNAESKITEISCMVPFAIDDCYLRDPNNTVYFPESIRFQRQRLYGKCAFTNMPIIAGTWTCGTIGRDYEKEVLQDIEVIVKSKYGEVLTPLLKQKRSATAELMCKSPFEEPISHCAFIDPLGRVHLVRTTSGIKTAGHVQYFGRGTELGECGIKISDINADDFGVWKCQFIIYSGRLTSTFTMQLTESALAHATSVGLGIGLTIMILLIMGVAIGTIFYRRRHFSARHNFVSTDALEMSASAATVGGIDTEETTNC